MGAQPSIAARPSPCGLEKARAVRIDRHCPSWEHPADPGAATEEGLMPHASARPKLGGKGLLTPDNCVVALIDLQPQMLFAAANFDRAPEFSYPAGPDHLGCG
jgi:hypothetical protein